MTSAKVRTSAVAALAAAGLVITALPAQAVENQPYDLSNDHSRARGDVTWYDGSRVVISGQVNDVCPNNGRVPDLDVSLVFADGSRSRRDLVRDDGRCTSPTATFSKSFDPQRRITRVVLHLCEGSDCVSRTKNNPYP